MSSFSRRRFLSNSAVIAAGAAATACSVVDRRPAPIIRAAGVPFPGGAAAPLGGPAFPPYDVMYASVADGGFVVPAVPYQQVPRQFLRQVVPNTTGEAPGTIIVSTGEHFLYYTMPGGKAVRYGVGLGRAGFEWSGRAVVERKEEWPRWYPPEEMVDREPRLEPYRVEFNKDTGEYTGGMDAGITNPLGARAMYLYEDGVDTLYRIHGSPEWNSIGKSVSSGCVRLMNQDVIDLYSRVAVDTPVLVR